MSSPPSLNVSGRGIFHLVKLCHDALGQLLAPRALNGCSVFVHPEACSMAAALISSPYCLDLRGSHLPAQFNIDSHGKPHSGYRLALGRGLTLEPLVVPP